MISCFKTVSEPAGPVEIKEKSSRFISCCFPVKTKEDVDNILKKQKKEYYDSTHICYAYILGNGEISQFRYNDDGEPSGTAGIPVYNEILRKELFNVLVTSVRYFGGVKLGTGGLARAYGTSARAVLETAQIKIVSIKEMLILKAPYDMTGLSMNHIGLFEGTEIISNGYDEAGIVVELMVPVGSVQKFIDDMTEKSRAKVSIIKKSDGQ